MNRPSRSITKSPNPAKLLAHAGCRAAWHFATACLLLLYLATAAIAKPAFDITMPASFFTNVANLVLNDETATWLAQNPADFTNSFGASVTNGFGVTNIPVFINGSLVYSSSVQRLLQVTANIYEAMSTNGYPAVYRPTFYRDPGTGNIFINGYRLIPSVSGIFDPALTQPVDISAIASGTVSNLNNVNIYGVPWIIGARKGFPSFYGLNMLNVAQISRLLQVGRLSTNNFNSANYFTNQMFVMSVSNTVGVSLWNSHGSNYVTSKNLTVFVQDTTRMTLTNNSSSETFYTNFFIYANLSDWPGSAANGQSGTNPAAFIATNWTVPFLAPSAYQHGSGTLIPLSFSPPWQTDVSYLYPFPQFGLATTNWLRAFILDGSNVIDYVQIAGPNSTRNLTGELTDPNFPDGTDIDYMWSTNGYPIGNTAGSPSFGVANQILLSRGFAGITTPPGGGWPAGTPPAEQQAYFESFFAPSVSYNGVRIVNTLYSMQAPYTPTRTLYNYTLWQPNDPLVHFLASDLDYYSAAPSLQKTDALPPVFNVPGLNLNQAGPRYQPWGVSSQMATLAGIDTNGQNISFRDPLISSSDAWNFPTNQTWNPDWLGQIHRGTPWQTVYLKSTNLLALTNFRENTMVNGLSTWEVWTGNTNLVDAARTAPVGDWHLAALLTAILDTNSSLTYFSVNNPDSNAWAAQLGGLFAITNGLAGSGIFLSSNSPAVTGLAAAIEATRIAQAGRDFPDVGTVFATPELSTASPFFEPGSDTSDAAYEALPSQLLAQLGLASQGTLISTNGQWLLQFTGAAGHLYVLQSSPDLLHWVNLGTSSPINGEISFSLPQIKSGTPQFYRSELVP